MTSIKELNLSPITYITLMLNGIKTIEGLSRFTEEELKQIKLPFSTTDLNTTPKDIIEEIKTRLNIIGLSLNTNNEEKVLSSEKRIKELNLTPVTIERLRRNGIITLGSLSTLDEKDFSRMYRIGKTTLDNIKTVLTVENNKIQKVEKAKMVYEGLSEEEIEYCKKQIDNVNEIVSENRKKQRIEAEENKAIRKRREKLIDMKLSELYIPEPVLKKYEDIDEEIIGNGFSNGLKYIILESTTKNELKIKDLHVLEENKIENLDEINHALSRLGIKNLRLGISLYDLMNLEITDFDLRRIEEYKLERHVDELKLQEKYYKARLTNEKLNKEISANKNIVEALEKATQEKERLEKINNELLAKIEELSNKLGVDVNGNKK